MNARTFRLSGFSVTAATRHNATVFQFSLLAELVHWTFKISSMKYCIHWLTKVFCNAYKLMTINAWHNPHIILTHGRLRREGQEFKVRPLLDTQ